MNTYYTPNMKEISMYYKGWKQMFKIWRIALYKRHNKFWFKITLV